jgi:hypothetical protein
MGYFSEEIREVCEKLKIKYEILDLQNSRRIYQFVEEKFFPMEEPDLRWTKRRPKIYYRSYSDPEAWKKISKITYRDSIYLMFDYDRDSDVVLIQEGIKISDILGECTAFTYYVTDIDFNYLLYQNFHDVFFRVGEKAFSCGASETAKKSPKQVLEDYANARAVKSFIGTKVDPNNLPSGYLYGKIPMGKDALGQDIYREVVYMQKPKNTRAPLVVENGKIALGEAGEYRIVSKKDCDKNVETIPGRFGKLLGELSQVHHLFADNLLRGTAFGRRALRLGAINPDGSLNLIELASSKNKLVAEQAMYPNVSFSDFIHNTQHPRFDKLMQTVVDGQIKALREAKGLVQLENEKFIPQMTKEEIKAVWDESLARMQSGLMGEDAVFYEKVREITRPDKDSLAQGKSSDDIGVD